MKKKIIIGTLAVLAAGCMSLALAGCGTNDTGWGTENTVETAYAAAVKAGYTGTFEEFLRSIKGDKGEDGKDGENGKDGAQGIQGEAGKDGKSAYEIWLANGHEGTQADFLNWLKGATGAQGDKGEDGKDGENGKDGAQGIQGEAGKDGTDGKSAYEVWLANGHTGTQADFLNWLKGATGAQGDKGDKGDKGEDGKDGENGKDGAQGDKGDKGEAGKDGKSAYEIWLANGHEGTEEDFLNWLKQSGCEHVYSNWEILSAANCTSFGLEVRVCTKCNDEKYRVTAALGHDFENEICKICHFGKIESLKYKLNDDGLSYTVVGTLWTLGSEITIPATYRGKPVTAIGAHVFQNLTDLTSITLPASVTKIGDSAFVGCSGLTSIRYNGDLAGWCSIEGLQWLTWYRNLERAIYINGEEIKGELRIPEGVTTIGDYAFRECSSLTSITLPASVMKIGDSAFNGCSGLTSIHYNGDLAGWCNIEGLGSLMYYGGQAGRALYIDGEEIKGELRIPEGVTRISDYAFYRCDGLTSITIPEGVTTIGEYAFNGCSSLTSIRYNGDLAGWCNIEGLEHLMPYNREVERVLYINGEEVKGELRIPEGVTEIGNAAFRLRSGLQSVIIPTSVTTIGNEAFSGCNGLASITIPESVTTIGYGAFLGCSSLTSITIPDGVTTIGDWAFYGCGLTSITIPESVTTIGDGVFNDCNGLTSIEVAAGNTKYHSADNCLIETETKTLILGCANSVIPADGSVTTIGNSAFYNCSGLTSITIPASVTTIGSSAFSGCTGLTSITIPASVTVIGSWAFNGCTGLTSATILGGVTTIGNSVFGGCTGLTSVTIPASVTTIGYDIFYSCTSLTDIYYNGTKGQWDALYQEKLPSGCTVHCTNGDIVIE